jgi:hypothetical protein
VNGELKVYDYWFLGTDCHMDWDGRTLSFNTTTAPHHFLVYRNWRLLREYVDGDLTKLQLLSPDQLACDAYEVLLSTEQQLARDIHQALVT